MEFWINQAFNGISYAALLFLLGGGFTLIFGVMKIVNIAHGSFYLLGGYIGYTVVSLTGNFYLAFLVACCVIAVLGMVMERVFLRDVAGQDLRQMLITMGIALFFQDLSLVIWGGNPLNLAVPPYLQKRQRGEPLLSRAAGLHDRRGGGAVRRCSGGSRRRPSRGDGAGGGGQRRDGRGVGHQCPAGHSGGLRPGGAAGRLWGGGGMRVHGHLSGIGF